MKRILTAGAVLALGASFISVSSLALGGGPAGASASLIISQSANLLNGQLLSVSGSGYHPSDIGGAVECNNYSPAGHPQPTMNIDGFTIPVSCNVPAFSPGYPFQDDIVPNFSETGTFDGFLVVHTGITGPPQLGLDSAGNSSAADAADYPCPPTAAQQSAGASCVITLGDNHGDSASVPISFATPIVASPAVQAVPSTNLSSGQSIQVTGSGFTPGSPFVAIECNVTPGEPTGAPNAPNLPVGCGSFTSVPPLSAPFAFPAGSGPGPPRFPTTAVTDGSGSLSVSLPVAEGNIGGSPTSAAYPCPPSPANVSAGGSCVALVETGANEQASVPLDITGPVPTPTITANPSTGLVGWSSVLVNGSGFLPGQSVTVSECNTAPGEPTVTTFTNLTLPVGCSFPFGGTVTASGGTFSTRVSVRTGTIGPPPPFGLDSAGNPANVDAANYPCPPTAAQQAAGVTCALVASDQAGDSASAPITFVTLPPGLSAPAVAIAGTPSGNGYWLAAQDGGVYTFGAANYFGSMGGQPLAAPVVALSPTPDGGGYLEAASDGGVFAFGDAGFHGSMGGRPLNAPVVALAATPDGGGYLEAAADGGVFAFGDAGFHGSMGGRHLNAPIVGLALTPDGRGYWEVGADGGIFAFGDAVFHGSMGAQPLNQPVVGMAASADGGGYWEVASDGGLFTFGDAVFNGSTGANPPNQVITAMGADPLGGYWLLGGAGGVWAFGAPYFGSFTL